MYVRDIMTESPTCCEVNTALKDVAETMIECDCGCVPVLDSNSRPVGIVTDRDIVIRTLAEGKNPLEMIAGDVMTRDVQCISAEASVESCCSLMEEKQIRRVVVTDEKGKCVGIVAQADVASYAPKQQTAEVVRQVSKPN